MIHTVKIVCDHVFLSLGQKFIDFLIVNKLAKVMCKISVWYGIHTFEFWSHGHSCSNNK